MTGSGAGASETVPLGEIPTTTLADILGPEHVMDAGLRSLWSPASRVSGQAFTVRCPAGDNLMFHAAIYRAPPGSIIVADAGDPSRAVAGGNVCAVAQRRGVAAFVVDGTIRDLGEVRELGFPVFARGVVAVAGSKSAVLPLGGRIRCGGVDVEAGDVVVADEDGVAIVPAARAAQVLLEATARLAKEAGETLDAWEAAHRARIEELLDAHGPVG
ncbi:MAG TPA: RraA family protein [Gaiellaceae bacterium]|nr:RraA family protein [Gaiellaceae bacterium]